MNIDFFRCYWVVVAEMGLLFGSTVLWPSYVVGQRLSYLKLKLLNVNTMTRQSQTEYEKSDIGKTVGACMCGAKMKISKVTDEYVTKKCTNCSMTHEDSRNVNGGVR